MMGKFRVFRVFRGYLFQHRSIENNHETHETPSAAVGRNQRLKKPRISRMTRIRRRNISLCPLCLCGSIRIAESKGGNHRDTEGTEIKTMPTLQGVRIRVIRAIRGLFPYPDSHSARRAKIQTVSSTKGLQWKSYTKQRIIRSQEPVPRLGHERVVI